MVVVGSGPPGQQWTGVTSNSFSPEEVSAQADHCILGGVQTDVALESAVLAAAVGRRRAAGSGTRVVGGRGGARGRRGGGGGHLKTDPLNE